MGGCFWEKMFDIFKNFNIRHSVFSPVFTFVTFKIKNFKWKTRINIYQLLGGNLSSLLIKQNMHESLTSIVSKQQPLNQMFSAEKRDQESSLHFSFPLYKIYLQITDLVITVPCLLFLSYHDRSFCSLVLNAPHWCPVCHHRSAHFGGPLSPQLVQWQSWPRIPEYQGHCRRLYNQQNPQGKKTIEWDNSNLCINIIFSQSYGAMKRLNKL